MIVIVYILHLSLLVSLGDWHSVKLFSVLCGLPDSPQEFLALSNKHCFKDRDSAYDIFKPF